MGVYLNPGNGAFGESIEKEIYVDKSFLIGKVWRHAKRMNKYICISRPRRFGKSTDANMLTAFYSKGCDSEKLFCNLKISDWDEYRLHLNHHNVIHLDMQMFLSEAATMEDMAALLTEEVAGELEEVYGIVPKRKSLPFLLNKIYAQTGETFIFVIDEWDCIFREYKENTEAQRAYLEYLRFLLKEKPYVELAYMTGILPIKKYGTHSALNMFDEISMLDAKDYSEYMGFTDDEVEGLCGRFGVDYAMMKEWYNGYHMRGGISVYSPRSVTASINNKDFACYWSKTETYEALKTYIELNYDGLKDSIMDLLAGGSVKVDSLSFQNDMSSFSSRDDVLTLLIHLGYLGYMYDFKEVYIPNNEVKDIFTAAVKNSNWTYVARIFRNANDLLTATWNMQADRVASYIQDSHYETSILQYNDENALSYTVSLAYITAKEYYTIIRELPTGKGFADIVFIPKKDKPAMVVELKYDKMADTGIKQIKEKRYCLGLEAYLDNLLLVAISYDKNTKTHECVIERYEG